MIQYGDITKLSGYDLDPVDLIVGGSPCQDLSVAGKRAGLDGERSGLFMEMIRIIKEMRNKTNGEKPKFGLWENVPGAFSSNAGRDFSAVLGEFARIIEPQAPDVLVPEEGWPDSGILLVGGGGSIAWRTHDAQFWGVPQRRRRISLVADFRGESAPEILFERKGMSGNFESSSEKGKSVAGTAADSTGTANGFNGWQSITASMPILYEKTPPIEATMPPYVSLEHQNPIVMNPRPISMVCGESSAPTLGADDYKEPQIVFDPSVHHGYKQFDDISETVRSRYGTGGNNQRLVVATMQGFGDYVESGTASSCKQRDYKDATDLVYGSYQDKTGSLMASGYDKLGTQEAANDMYEANNTVRRLTPLECERLQGYPDGWTDIPGATDSKRYKALGNSIALPFWEHLAYRFAEIGNVKSIGSLFDGIGGFPLVFKRAGAETKWTSEIEPFPEQVVKYHLDKGDL